MRKKINPEETVSISFEFILTIQQTGLTLECRVRHPFCTDKAASKNAVPSMRESAEKVLHFNFSPIQGAKTSMTSVHHFSCRANFSRRTSSLPLPLKSPLLFSTAKYIEQRFLMLDLSTCPGRFFHP